MIPGAACTPPPSEARAWRLRVRAIESPGWREVPATVRLRRALKALARGYGLTVVAIEAEAQLEEESHR